MLDRLDHIGIAVRDLDRALALYRDVLGMKHLGTFDDAGRQLRAAVMECGDVHLELLVPATPESVIGRFLEKRGEGIHHLCFEVDDIRAALAGLEAAGLRLVDREPRPGVGGHLVAFVHPASTGGVLLEVVEKKKQPSTGSV
ncbi:MAG: methylmalonyl-CoA epimerase [Candidatus Riflebacteria bacterium]|nr:methylmalonyl-CoA epimerase [Candidatus Riflebacteria bacterium]